MGRKQKITYPEIINLPITEHCNSKCVMCNVWQNGLTDTISSEQIRRIFSQTIFKKVKHVGVSGGEPTLNPELVEIFEALCESIINLKGISITTNGFSPKALKDKLTKIKEITLKHNVYFSVNISLDGIGEVHDKVRGTKGAFEKVMATISVVRELGLPFLIQCTVSSANIYNVVKVREFAILNQIDVIFAVATNIARLTNNNVIEEISLNQNEKSFLADFLSSKRTILATRSLGRRLFYKELSKRLITNEIRKAPCPFKYNGLFVAPNSKIYSCSRSNTEFDISNIDNIKAEINSKKNREIISKFIANECDSCYHGQQGGWSKLDYIKVTNLYIKITSPFLNINKIPIILNGLFSSLFLRKNNSVVDSYSNALILGCYGGEHVGDAAILGGVILRYNNTYGTTNFTVLSSRPDRTERWVSCLKFSNDIRIKCKQYNSNEVNTKEFGYAVIAGGPLMEIPALISKHIIISKKFQKASKPFYIESVGIGPIKLHLTNFLINKLLKYSTKASVRTHNDLEKIDHINSEFTTKMDPAFEYIDYLKKNFLNTYSNIDNEIDKITKSNKDIIVINLRALWNRYSNVDLNKLESNIIETIYKFINKYKENNRFIFLPMNADQYGSSDLMMAYKLEKKLENSDIDFIILEKEVEIIETLYLFSLSKLNISMRFHSCIFSLAMGIETIGLDYIIGEKAKVFSLFKDLSKESNVLNISNINISLLDDVYMNLMN